MITALLYLCGSHRACVCVCVRRNAGPWEGGKKLCGGGGGGGGGGAGGYRSSPLTQWGGAGGSCDRALKKWHQRTSPGSEIGPQSGLNRKKEKIPHFICLKMISWLQQSF